MMRNRKGFTAIEIALTTVIVGLMAAIALPKFGDMREAGELNAAKRQLITQLGAARASAIQRARAVELHADGAEIWLMTEIKGADTEIGVRVKNYETLDVKIEASESPIIFDSRGFATSLPATGAKFLLYRGERSDSVCVTRFGTLLPECGP
jgi:prepilin-type N-terminal cleavage/methylation domain-containing protein